MMVNDDDGTTDTDHTKITSDDSDDKGSLDPTPSNDEQSPAPIQEEPPEPENDYKSDNDWGSAADPFLNPQADEPLTPVQEDLRESENDPEPDNEPVVNRAADPFLNPQGVGPKPDNDLTDALPDTRIPNGNVNDPLPLTPPPLTSGEAGPVPTNQQPSEPTDPTSDGARPPDDTDDPNTSIGQN